MADLSTTGVNGKSRVSGARGGASKGPDSSKTGVAAVWRAAASCGFLDKALQTGEAMEVYKAAIKFAAMVRRSMSELDCRRASVELILEADTPPDCF
jgi:hypothetical protein